MDVAASKKALRESTIARRDGIGPQERERKSALVCERLAALLDEALEEREERGPSSSELPRPHGPSQTCGLAPVVSVYAAMNSEVDLARFVAYALERGCSVAYPCMMKNPEWSPEAAQAASNEGSFVPKNLMEFRAVRSVQDAWSAPFVLRPLCAWTHGSPELDPWPLVEPERIDFAVCPLVAYEDSGCRLGYGGGNYDRLLSQLDPHARVFGVAFEEQRVADGTIPREAHDIPLPAVISA